MSDDVFALEPADQGRIWFRDLVHTPRALPPLAGDLNAQFAASSVMGLDNICVRGYSYSSPRTMGPPNAEEPLATGQALKNWHERYLPEVQKVYENFRDADYASMDAAAIVSFFKSQLPTAADAFAGTIASAMELGPDADRLSALLETKLGADGELLSASILHGAGTETRSLGTEVQQLAEAARATPAAEAALVDRDFSAATRLASEPWAGALKAFLQDHEDEVALWSEIHEPAWNEDPTPLMRLVAATLAAPPQDRRNQGEAAIAEVRERLAPEDLPEFDAALALSRDYVPVIEHRARWQLKLVGGARRTFVALGQKMVETGRVDSPNDIFFVYYDELDAAARGDLDVRQLVATRKREWEDNLKLSAPMTLGLPISYEMIGKVSPMLRRMFGAVAINPATATVVSGIGGNAGVVRGRARIVDSLADADELLAGDILVCPSTSPPWTPYFAVVAAVVTDAGGVLSHAAIEAREYGIPAVVGTREATRRIPEGAMITVDGSAGTVTIEA